MKIIIAGVTGTGKTYFFLPQIIKLLNKKNIFRIKTFHQEDYSNLPHWKNIKWKDWNNEKLGKDDLIFVDGLELIEKEEERDLIKNNKNVIVCCFPDYLGEIENLKEYIVIPSRYIKPNRFPFNLFSCPLRKRKKELKKNIEFLKKME